MPVDKIPWVDHPELKINKNESTQMPFRYVKGEDGQPIMPKVCAPISLDHVVFQIHRLCAYLITQGMVELIIKDSEKSLDDLL